MMQRKRTVTALIATLGSLCLAAVVSAEPYELSKNDLTDPKGIASQDVLTVRHQAGDDEAKALDGLVNEKNSRHQGEQEATFIFCWINANQPVRWPGFGCRMEKWI